MEGRRSAPLLLGSTELEEEERGEEGEKRHQGDGFMYATKQ